MTDINSVYCGGHFAIYTNVKSLCCTPEINIKSSDIYTAVRKNAFLILSHLINLFNQRYLLRSCAGDMVVNRQMKALVLTFWLWQVRRQGTNK